MTQTNDPRKVKVIVELIDHTSKIADAQDRGDLAERMAKAKARITDPQIRVVIAGQLKQGKSQLLNSLLNVPVARVGDDETTVVATVVSYGEQASAKLMVAGADEGEPEVDRDPDRRHQERPAPPSRGRRPQVLRVEVTAHSPLLKGGLAFVDTPGVGGHGQPHLSATLGLLPDADAMLMISDTSQEFTEPEMTFIRQAFEICPVATHCRHQDRPLSALAGDRRGQQGAPAARRARDTDDSGVVAAAQPRHPAQRQGTQRGVQLPGHREVPQRQGAVPRERPGARPGARRDPVGSRAFDACRGLRAVGAQRSGRPATG